MEQVSKQPYAWCRLDKQGLWAEGQKLETRGRPKTDHAELTFPYHTMCIVVRKGESENQENLHLREFFFLIKTVFRKFILKLS